MIITGIEGIEDEAEDDDENENLRNRSNFLRGLRLYGPR